MPALLEQRAPQTQAAVMLGKSLYFPCLPPPAPPPRYKPRRKSLSRVLSDAWLVCLSPQEKLRD